MFKPIGNSVNTFELFFFPLNKTLYFDDPFPGETPSCHRNPKGSGGCRDTSGGNHDPGTPADGEVLYGDESSFQRRKGSGQQVAINSHYSECKYDKDDSKNKFTYF